MNTIRAKHKHKTERIQRFTAPSRNLCNFTLAEKAVDNEIRIGIYAKWVHPPTRSDLREFHAYMRSIASERGDIEEFTTADRRLVQDRPGGTIERFLETGDAGVPVKPVRYL